MIARFLHATFFLLCTASLISAFRPLRPVYGTRKFMVQMISETNGNSVSQSVGKALSAISLSVGLFSGNPAFAESSLKATLSEYKTTAQTTESDSTPEAKPYTAKKDIVVKLPTPAPVAPKPKPAPAPAPAPAPKPVKYEIKPDTELLSKVAAVKKTSQSAASVAASSVVKTPAAASAPAAVVSKPTPAPVKKPAEVKVFKLQEEAAVDGAIKKKASDKEKLVEINADLKQSQSKASSLRSEVKKFESKIESLENKLKKKDLDKDIRDTLSREKSELSKLNSDAKSSLRSAESAVERDLKEIDSLNNRLKEDDKNIANKQEELKKKKEQLAKETKIAAEKKAKAEADAKAAAALKEYKNAESAQKKAEQELQSAVNNGKGPANKLADTDKALRDERENEKKAESKVKSLEESLKKAREEAAKEQEKITELNKKAASLQQEINSNAEVVKQKQAAVKIAAEKTAAAKKNAKL